MKLKKNEPGSIVNESNMSVDYQANSLENIPTNGHAEILYKPSNNVVADATPITNMLANLNDEPISTTTNVEKTVPSQMPVVSTLSSSDLTVETSVQKNQIDSE